MKSGIALAVSLVLSSSAMAAQSPPVEHIGEPSINGQRLPFSEAVRVGDMFYLSGQLGNKPDGTLPDGIEAQARQAMDNIGAVLKRSGSNSSGLVQCRGSMFVGW